MNPLLVLSQWLEDTALSAALGSQHWITPALQTVHIAAVGAVMGSVLILDFRLLGRGRHDPFPTAAANYLPWIWIALAILLVTGTLLVVGEPVRSLTNWVFLLKMGLVSAAAGLTAAATRPMNEALAAGHAVARPVLALSSLALWVAIVFAGRWIAYV